MKISIANPESLPLCSALSKALWFMIPDLAVLIRIDPGFTRFSSRAPIRFRVISSSGRWIVMMSDCLSRSLSVV